MKGQIRITADGIDFGEASTVNLRINGDVYTLQPCDDGSIELTASRGRLRVDLLASNSALINSYDPGRIK